MDWRLQNKIEYKDIWALYIILAIKIVLILSLIPGTPGNPSWIISVMASVCPFGSFCCMSFWLIISSILKIKNIFISFSFSPSGYPGLHSNSDFGCRPWEYELMKRSFFIHSKRSRSSRLCQKVTEIFTLVYYRMLGSLGLQFEVQVQPHLQYFLKVAFFSNEPVILPFFCPRLPDLV